MIKKIFVSLLLMVVVIGVSVQNKFLCIGVVVYGFKGEFMQMWSNQLKVYLVVQDGSVQVIVFDGNYDVFIQSNQFDMMIL